MLFFRRFHRRPVTESRVRARRQKQQLLLIPIRTQQAHATAGWVSCCFSPSLVSSPSRSLSLAASRAWSVKAAEGKQAVRIFRTMRKIFFPTIEATLLLLLLLPPLPLLLLLLLRLLKTRKSCFHALLTFFVAAAWHGGGHGRWWCAVCGANPAYCDVCVIEDTSHHSRPGHIVAHRRAA